MATEQDAELLLNDSDTRRWSVNATPAQPEDHLRWLRATFESPQRLLLIAEAGADPVGTVRFDELNAQRWEIGITIAPEQRERLGRKNTEGEFHQLIQNAPPPPDVP